MSEQDESLLSAARDAAKKAYAPYSHFRVGAAVRVGGDIFTGCNIENASYGLTVCAERNAIFRAIGSGVRAIEAIALACVDAPADASPGLLMPCGACLQVMTEFATADLPVMIDSLGRRRLADLLPAPFKLTTVD